MLTRILRVASLLQLAAAVALAALLIYVGTPAWIAVILGAAVPFLLHAIALGVEFITGAIIDRRPVRRLNPIDAIGVWLTESWRSATAFTIDQAWRAGFPDRLLVHDPARPAVLLVHGYLCNRGVWRPWLLGGLPARWNIATVSLEPVYGAIEGYADALHRAVGQLQAASGAERVTLVCHSMGGLAARAYLRRYDDAAVGRVVTIDTPHQGTIFAHYGHGLNTRQMRRASEYLASLALCDEPVEFVCFASRDDNLIVPRESQVLKCAETVWFEKIGHLAMTASDVVLAKLIEVVERPHVRLRACETERLATHGLDSR